MRRDAVEDLKILDSAATGFYAVDTAGVTTLCNKAMVDMLGCGHAREAIGRQLHDNGGPRLPRPIATAQSFPDGSFAYVTDGQKRATARLDSSEAERSGRNRDGGFRSCG